MPRYIHPDTGSQLDTDEADYASTWKARGFVLADAATAEGADADAAASEDKPLSKMTRDELDAHAVTLGVDPTQYATKADLTDAIEAAQGGQPSENGTTE